MKMIFVAVANPKITVLLCGKYNTLICWWTDRRGLWFGSCSCTL